MKNKIAILIIFVLTISFSLTGCGTPARGVDSFSYVIAIGFDKGESNTLKITFQFAMPSDSSGDQSTSQSSDSTTISIECSSFDSGINLVNGFISKKINLSHCKVIIFSEVLAYQGISEHLYAMLNNTEIRPSCNILVSRCNAEEFLKRSNPALETHTARYYDTITTSTEKTGYSDSVHLFDFYSDFEASFVQATATLVGVNFESTHLKNSNTPNIDIDSSYKADQTPVSAKLKIENMGTAVFYDDRLVGELDGIETICYLLCINKFTTTTISISNPLKENSQITLAIYPKKATKNKVEIINGSPLITTEINLKANILSADIDSNFSSQDSFETLDSYINHYFQEQMSDFLYKTAKEFNSDIIGFGEKIRKNYLFIKDIENVNWLENYRNSFFDCKVNTTVESGVVLLKS